MKKFYKLLALLVCAVMVFSAGACNNKGGDNASTTADGTNTTVTDEAKTYTVGISQLVQHVALDAATKGFKDALTAKLGDKVKFDEKNAQGDAPTCASIANGFVAAKVDLIMANATPALQAAAAATADIPVLGTSITEYGVALDIKDFTGTVGTNVSGTSDLAPLDQQAAMVKALFPDVKKVGLLYCSAEANSDYQVKTIEKMLADLGYECTKYPFTDSNDLASVTTKAADESEVIYVPTDNTVASNTGIIDNICRPKKVPVIAGEEGICAGCGVATLSIDYYDLGFATGEMAYKILTGESKVSEMPIEYAPKFTKKYNKEICDELGVKIPSDYEVIETK